VLFHNHKSLELLHRIGRYLQHLTSFKAIIAVLEEVDVCKSLVQLLSGVMNEFVKIDETLPTGIISLIRNFKNED
jgi:hypothetical protein